jgi:hypothetical protein
VRNRRSARRHCEIVEARDGTAKSPLWVRPLDDEVTPTVLSVIIADGRQQVFHEGLRLQCEIIEDGAMQNRRSDAKS